MFGVEFIYILSEDSMTDISVIGLGDMGSALASTLLNNGYSVAVWNRTADKADPLIAAGAVLASSAEEAIAASPATITCITSHARTIQLIEDISLPLEGKTIIELSTGGITERSNYGHCSLSRSFWRRAYFKCDIE